MKLLLQSSNDFLINTVKTILKDNNIIASEEIDTLEYFKFLKNMFRFKRKNIRNNINGIYDIEKINNTLNKYGLSVSNRSEELSEEILLDIFKNSLK